MLDLGCYEWVAEKGGSYRYAVPAINARRAITKAATCLKFCSKKFSHYRFIGCLIVGYSSAISLLSLPRILFLPIVLCAS